MKNIKELTEKKAELKAKMQKIIDTAETENRAISAEESADFDNAESEIRAIDDTIAKAEKMRAVNESVQLPADGESVEKTEERAFADYIRGRAVEMRAGEQNITMANNSAVIPTTIAGRIIDAVVDLCPILAGAEVYHVKGTLKIPKWTKANSTHDITVGYSDEFKELTADSGEFTSVDLTGYLSGALTLIGKSVMNNSNVDLVGFVVNKMAEKIAEFLEKELLTGTEKAQGALSTANKVTAANADSLTFEDIVKLQSAVKQVYQKNACWTMNPETFTGVKLLKDNNGRPLLEADITQEFPYLLLGKPVYLSDNMPKVGASAKSVLYGDYSGLSVNMREDISIEILREKYATQHALGVVSWFEFDSKVTDEQKLAVLEQAGS